MHKLNLACWLLGIQTPQHLEIHPLRGAIFETLIVAELIKSRLNRGERPGMCFWRDSNGNKVDVIIEAGEQLIPVEIKSGKTVARVFFASLDKWKTLAGTRALNPILIYGGDDQYRHATTDVMGWRHVGRVASVLEKTLD